MIENIINCYGLYIIIAEFVSIVFILLWHFFFSDDNSEEISSLKQENKILGAKVSDKQVELDKYKYAFDQANIRLKQWDVWYNQNKHLLIKEEQKSAVIEFDLSQDRNQANDSNQVSYQYLQEANTGKFMRLFTSPDKCYFRTWDDGGVRRFEFCGNVAKALANINAIFDDVCDIEGKRSGASDIENVAPGTLDSELRITNKAKIRLK